ncbi:MAG: acetate--CoA ligase family protein [Desulfobacterales bacterium]|nr:acetate--CoA ligase family protein [Desulfobacterales bacterium]
MTEFHSDILQIIEAARGDGWVLEPDAKRLFSLAGFTVPRFALARNAEEARRFAREIGYPVVAKVVSPRILHKSEVHGVVVGIDDEGHLMEVFERLRGLEGFLGMLVEEMVSGGIELILGAKIDVQFGPMILLGMGGTGVEIYKDVALRMAPLVEKDALAMVGGLKARRLLEGYRGAEPVDRGKLTETLLAFSSLVMELEGRIDSVDINPLLCSAGGCVVADARIILRR